MAIVLANATPFSIVYTQVALGEYFWPGELVSVTIGASEYDLSVNNSLAGVLTVYLDGIEVGSLLPGGVGYWNPGIAKGWLAQNISLVLTDPNTNATLSSCVPVTSMMFFSRRVIFFRCSAVLLFF